MKKNNDGASNFLKDMMNKVNAVRQQIQNAKAGVAGKVQAEMGIKDSSKMPTESKMPESVMPAIGPDGLPITKGGMDGGAGSLTMGEDTYTVIKQPSSNGTGSARPTFAVNDVNRLSSADHTGGPMMKDLIGKSKNKDGASFRIFGIGKLSEGQKRRRGIVDTKDTKLAKKSQITDMTSSKQKIGDLQTEKIGKSAKTSGKKSKK